MNTDKHIVTLPIKDYNELLEAKEFVGLKRLDKDTLLWKQLNDATRHLTLKSTGTAVGIEQTIELYYKPL